MIPTPQTDTSPSTTSLYTGSNEEVKKIVNTYLILHRIFFGLGVNIIVIICSILITRNITSATTPIPFPIRDTETKAREQELITTLSVIESKSYKENDVRVIIKQGPLAIDHDYIETNNNLILYKGYVTPRSIKIPISDELKTISYFNNSGYDIKYLDLYMSSFILNSYKNQNTIDTTNTLLPLQTTFTKQFSIECLLSSKIINVFCEQAFDTISSVIPLYNLKQDYAGLAEVSHVVQGTPYAPKFCEAIKRHIFFSNDSGKEIKEIMVACGKQYELSIADFISFRSIQEQLSRESISSTVTSSTLLNIYKLLSTQNDIYYDIIIGKTINTTRINGYNNYVEALLKSPDMIQGFYFDVIARYNNVFLIPQLTEAVLVARGERSDDYKKSLEQIKKLNQGDSVANYKGLTSYLMNKNLLQLGFTDLGTGQNSVLGVVENFKQNYNFSDFIVKSTSGMDDKTLSVSGLLRFATTVGLANNTPMNALLVYKDQRFFVTSVVLPRHLALTAIINQKLKIQSIPISEVYNLIIENSTTKKTEDVCPILKANKNLTNCTPTQVTFTQNKIKYSFDYTLENGISSYTIGDAGLDTSTKTTYGKTVNVTKNIVDAINLILNYTIPKEETTKHIDPTGGAKEVQIQKDFEQIGATIKDITTNNNNTVVKFTLKNYSFISIYDTNKKTILGLGIVLGTTYPIRNFTFSFLTAAPEDIALLKDDPASFLLQKDPLTVKKLQLK